MFQNDKHITNLLLLTQIVGIVFVGFFLAAYLGGMLMNPSTTVLHNEPAFRIPLTIFGTSLLILVLATVIMAAISKRSMKPEIKS
jgi:hypothetical protein